MRAILNALPAYTTNHVKDKQRRKSQQRMVNNNNTAIVAWQVWYPDDWGSPRGIRILQPGAVELGIRTNAAGSGPPDRGRIKALKRWIILLYCFKSTDIFLILLFCLIILDNCYLNFSPWKIVIKINFTWATLNYQLSFLTFGIN